MLYLKHLISNDFQFIFDLFKIMSKYLSIVQNCLKNRGPLLTGIQGKRVKNDVCGVLQPLLLKMSLLSRRSVVKKKVYKGAPPESNAQNLGSRSEIGCPRRYRSRAFPRKIVGIPFRYPHHLPFYYVKTILYYIGDYRRQSYIHSSYKIVTFII